MQRCHESGRTHSRNASEPLELAASLRLNENSEEEGSIQAAASIGTKDPGEA